MRSGFTTGSCSAAGAKAAAYMLLSGKKLDKISLVTPAGIKYEPELTAVEISESQVSCGVYKDSGDDPDVTNGALILAKVWCDNYSEERVDSVVTIHGGKGVGVVTKPGLDQKVGEAAINSVPRSMIENGILEVARFFDYHGDWHVEISVPNGEELAKETFNGRLGIEGGISILGTSGIVEPMSQAALIATIKLDIHQQAILGSDGLVISPGNYGRDFLKNTLHYDIDRSVKCSNFIGDTLDIAVDEGFERLVLVGHIGKLVKVAGGMMNTHSKEGDCRMEILSSVFIKHGGSLSGAKDILNQVSTEEAVKVIEREGLLGECMDEVVERICSYMKKRVNGRLDIDVIVFSNELGILGKSKGADRWFTL